MTEDISFVRATGLNDINQLEKYYDRGFRPKRAELEYAIDIAIQLRYYDTLRLFEQKHNIDLNVDSIKVANNAKDMFFEP